MDGCYLKLLILGIGFSSTRFLLIAGVIRPVKHGN